MTTEEQARHRRARAAASYQPEIVRLLLVAEAPPPALDRYFYFEDVREHDSLFRHVVMTVLATSPSREGKRVHLERLRERGVFLVDLKTDPKVSNEDLDRYVPGLVDRAVALAPEHVITIKANVCTLCQSPLRRAGLRISDERIPFPGSGQQGRFVDRMTRALNSIGWEP